MRTRLSPGLSVALLTALMASSRALGLPPATQQDGGRVEGVVVDLAGRPIPGAQVILEPLGLRSRTDEDGRFRFPAVLAGAHRLRLTRIGYRTTVRDIELVAGHRVEVRVALEVRPVTLAEIVAEGALDAGVGRSTLAFSRRDLAAYTGRSAGDLLAGSGVGHITARGGTGSSQAISLRGSRPEGVLVLLDGAPLNDPITGAADLSLVPVEGLESVRVLPGTGGALYGPGAIGGVVLLRRRAAGSGQYVSLGGGSYGWRAGAAAGGFGLGAGGFAFSARVSAVTNDYPFTLRIAPGEPTLRRRNADASEVGLSVRWSARGGGVELSASVTRTERGVPGPMGTTIFDRARLDVARGDAGARGQLGPWRWAVRGVGFRHFYRDRLNPSTNGNLQSFSLNASGVRGLRLGSARGTWLVAARGDWVEGTSLAGRPQRQAVAQGLALSAPLSWGTLSIGLRVDWWTSQGPFVSPELGVSARAVGLELRARAAQGVRAPTFADLYFASPIPVLRPSGLTAERAALDAEVGLRAPLGRAVELDAALYYRDVRDAIVWAPSSFVGWHPENVERVRAHGLELSARVRSEPWSADLRYEWTDPRFHLPLNRSRLPYVPEHQVVATVSATYRVSGRLRVRYLGRRTAGLTGAVRLPPAGIADLAASLPIRFGAVRTLLNAEALNLFATMYELVPLYPMPVREIRITTQLRWGREEEG